jgi:hypothetical protein
VPVQLDPRAGVGVAPSLEVLKSRTGRHDDRMLPTPGAEKCRCRRSGYESGIAHLGNSGQPRPRVQHDLRATRVMLQRSRIRHIQRRSKDLKVSQVGADCEHPHMGRGSAIVQLLRGDRQTARIWVAGMDAWAARWSIHPGSCTREDEIASRQRLEAASRPENCRFVAPGATIAAGCGSPALAAALRRRGTEPCLVARRLGNRRC